MLGVEVTEPSVLLVDNQAVVYNTTLPSNVLKKKWNAIAYHKARECVAAGIITVAHIRSEMNLSDILTKPLGPAKYWSLLLEPFYGRQFQEPANEGELQENMIPDSSQTQFVYVEHDGPITDTKDNSEWSFVDREIDDSVQSSTTET